jgi:hypothetical protein
MDRAQLEAMALEKISKMQTAPSQAIDRETLEQMALEKLSGMGQTPIDMENEASLGFANRARYAIEPIQSNRKALLEQEYGPDNVMEDKAGELFIKQNGAFLPVNKEGFSAADIADFAGATPEMIGGAVGTVAGAVGGAGAASIPGAIAIGGLGGAVGSAARQAISGAIGTPQVAGIGERFAETGLSGAFGAGGTALGLGAKAVLSKAKPGITQVIKNIKGEDVIESVGETASKSVANTTMDATGYLKPIYNEQTAETIMGEVVDQSGRNAVQSEMANLKAIAKRQGIPDPTYAQAAQGKALIAETKVMDTPLIGGKVRDTVDKQLKTIKKNIEDISGSFIDVDSNAYEVGLHAKKLSETGLELQKKMATELYDQVEEVGADAMIGKKHFFNKYRDEAAKLGLIKYDLSPEVYAAETGLTRTEFKALQDAFMDGMSALGNTQSDKVPFRAVNALRKTMNGTVEELREKNPNAARLLNKFADELNATAERVLNREQPKLGEVFKEANRNYAIFKKKEGFAKKLFKEGVGEEKITKLMMSDTAKVKEMKELIGDDGVREIAKSHVRDILSNLGKSGIGRADTALTKIKEKGAQIRLAIGAKDYDNLIDNLHFLNRTGQPLNVARASLYNLFDNRGPGIKQIALNVASAAKTLAESKGTTVGRAIKDKAVEKTLKAIPSSGKGFSNAANILSDDTQRGLSAFPGYKRGSVAEREREIEKRKRAISGSK